MAFVLLIVVLLIWVGYQYGRDRTDSGSNGSQHKIIQGHHLYPSVAELRERYAGERNMRLNSISPDATNWLAAYLGECESPAEEAFLRAMVIEYSLLPVAGYLQGGGLSLQLQVDRGAYRVDFLANDWLVIEIDGAEHHTSPEQVGRDKTRDGYFDSLGYTVVRLAAKMVFQQPERALSEIRSALAAGRKPPAAPRNQAPPAQTSRPPPANAFSAFFRGIEAVGDIAKNINDFAERQRAVLSATSAAQKIFLEEKLSINSAIEIANNKILLENYVDDDPDRRERLERVRLELKAAMAEDTGRREDRVFEPIPRISEPSAHLDPEIDEIIRRQHSALLEERTNFFATVRDQMRKSDGRLPTLVRATLIDLGRHSTWIELTGYAGQFSRVRGAPLLGDACEIEGGSGDDRRLGLSTQPSSGAGRHDAQPRLPHGLQLGRVAAEPLAADQPLFEALRAWRGREAGAQHVPPYVIFHDRTLAEIATVRPGSAEALATVSGMGKTKFERYGADVLSVIASFRGQGPAAG